MKFFLILILFSSCSKSLYIYKQGIGQISLEWNGRSNEEVLSDKNIEIKYKEKIKKIQKYKKFYLKYFDKKDSGIYDETTILEQKAVTYLVIASPFNEVRPIKVSFPIVGDFPYLGFFNKQDALDYKLEKEKEGFDTYIRPVYAYSTLDQWIFKDNILSSFFVYEDHDLAELIFHELTHTVLFIKNEVSFNESLAQYLGERLTEEYFNYNKERKKELEKQKIKRKEYSEMLSKFAHEMNQLYKNNQSKKEANQVLENHLKIKMFPRFKAFCQQYEMNNCKLLIQDWNNARLAAFLTYQNKQNLIEKIHKKHQFSLKKLLEYFENKYKEYQVKSLTITFANYLKQQENL